jgi:hypothetical protein
MQVHAVDIAHGAAKLDAADCLADVGGGQGAKLLRGERLQSRRADREQ